MRLEKTFQWRDTSGGVITKISSDIATQNSIPFAMNFEFDEDLGMAVSRLGTGIIGSQLSSGNPCLGLHNFRDSDSSNHGLLAAFNGSIYNVETAATLASSLSSSAKWHFITYLDTILGLNGTDSPLTGTTALSALSTSGGNLNVANIPTGANYPIEWHDRVYAAVRDRLYYTSVASNSTVSWTASGSGSIQIEQEDGGGNISALAKVPGYLLVFKQRSLKRWNAESTFPDDLVNIGTQSQFSVVYGRGICYFFYGPKGFFATKGGYPERISRPVQRFIDAIPSSYYENISGWCDNEHIYWSIGDITLTFDNGYTETHNNVVLRYSIDSQHWSAFKYADEFRAFSSFIDGTAIKLVGGNDDGEVLELNTGYSDYNNIAIIYILESPEFDFGMRGNKKIISDRIIVHHLSAMSAIIMARVDYGEWREIGILQNRNIVEEVHLKNNLEGHVFQFRIQDSNTGQQVKLRGLDFPAVDILENYV